MTHLGYREPRMRTLIEAEIRDGGSWAKVLICNISQRGMMLRGDRLPERDSHVEIRSMAVVVIGQVRWRRGNLCGLRLHEAVDISMLSGETHSRRGASLDVKQAAPALARATVETKQASASGFGGRLTEFSLVALACIALGAVAVGSIAKILDHPVLPVSTDIPSSRN